MDITKRSCIYLCVIIIGFFLPVNGEDCPALESSTVDFECIYMENEIPCDGIIKSETIVKAICKERHVKSKMYNSNILKCINGKWDNPIPECLKACKVPAQLENGLYSAHGEVVNPGDLVSFWSSLTYKCNDGYYPTSDFSYCDTDNVWIPDDVKCIRKCPNLNSSAVNYQCMHTGEEIPCDGIMKPNTSVKSSCKDKNIKLDPERSKTLTCVDGVWNNPPPKCVKPCIVPPRPANGNYKIMGNVTIPGEKVPFFSTLFYECNEFHVATSEYSKCDENGIWNPEIVRCIRACPNLNSTTVNFHCKYLGRDIPCDNIMKPNTEVTSTCKIRHIVKNLERLKKLKCDNGKWDNPIPKCTAECGEESSKGTPLIINGRTENKSGSPWHVAVYMKKNKKFDFICGGSIVSAKVVISAAHCFHIDLYGTILNSSRYAIAAGKRMRLWDTDEESAQKKNISKIITSELYGGFDQNLQHDIAILIMETAFTFGDSVHPVCLDLHDEVFKTTQITTGSFGKVVGWGLTEEGDINSASPVLLVAKIPVISYLECKTKMQSTFARYLIDDKICAGYMNGTTVCKGDSGGGLVFPSNERGTTKYYLRAIVSVSDLDEETGFTCKKHAYTAFTNIWKHREFIEKSISEYI